MSTPWAMVVICLAIAVLVLGVLQLGLMRRVMAVLEGTSAASANSGAPHGPGLRSGETVPKALAIDPSGQVVDASELSRSRSIVVLLASADCEPCHRVLTGLVDGGWHAPADLVVVVDEGQTEFDGELRERGLLVLSDSPTRGVAAALQSNVYPRAFALAEGKVAAPALIPTTADDLRNLAKQLPGAASTERRSVQLNK